MLAGVSVGGLTGMKNTRIQHWIAPSGVDVPDFIICGAMKCGTTTVHHVLGSHPHIFIPEGEINFFDMDDLYQHSDFLFREDNAWYAPDIADDPAAYWKWYSDFFSEAPGGSIIGEDSTCYLASPNAALRISLQRKPIKVIVCLRQPTNRAYSQYWHMLRSGRALFSFEDTIRYTPHYVLDRSMYLSQIENLLKHIPRERVFFFILEEYLADKASVARRLLEFLQVSFDDLPVDALSIHSNRGKYPKNVKVQAFKNRMLREYGNLSYAGKLPYKGPVNKKTSFGPGLVNKLHKRFNPLLKMPEPEMKAETRRFLDRFFERELDGLDELAGTNVRELWFPGDVK